MQSHMVAPLPSPKTFSLTSDVRNLLNVGIAGVAGVVGLCAMYPVESVKTIIQLRSEAGGTTSTLGVFKERIQVEGLGSLYKGLPAAVIRQFFFASIRVGLFFNVADHIKNKQKKDTLTLMESTVSSLGAAAIGITTVMPFDVIFVRFQAENALPADKRRGYTGMANAMSRIIKEEGVATLWRGLLPAVARSMALNFGMLVPYDKCKGVLAPYLGWTRTNFLASAAIAGFGAAVCCLPLDNAKVKLQKMTAGPDGKMPYKGLLDCFGKCIKSEGVLRLWSGFVPFYLYVAPHSMMVLLLSDALRIILGISKN